MKFLFIGTPRWLRGWASASGSGHHPRVLGSEPHQASCEEPASPSAYVSASLSVSHEYINKIFKWEVSIHIWNAKYFVTYGKFLMFSFTFVSVNLLFVLSLWIVHWITPIPQRVSHLGKKNVLNNDALWKLLYQCETPKYTNRYI